jgi:hypothetical protein
MNTANRLIVSFILLFLHPGCLWAEKYPAHIVIAADHSDSMHPHNMALQMRGLSQALEQYLETCDELRLSYIAWGSAPDPARTFLLNDTKSRHDFNNTLHNEIRYRSLVSTQHVLGLTAAIDHVYRTKASYSVIIFITDQVGEPVTDRELPVNTHLIKIALESSAVQRYLEQDFMPDQGQTLFTTNAHDLTNVIEDAFSMLRDACVG